MQKLARLGVVKEPFQTCVDLGKIVEGLDTGTYHFRKPNVGWVGQSFPFALILQTAKGQEKEIDEALNSVPGVSAQKEAQFAQNLEATLSGPDLKVQPAGPVARTVTKVKPVEWNWTVTPQSAGKKRLTIEVAANIVVGPEKTHVQLKVLHEDIDINISFFQQVKATLAAWNVFIISLAGFLGALGTIFAFVRPARQWIVGLFNR